MDGRVAGPELHGQHTIAELHINGAPHGAGTYDSSHPTLGYFFTGAGSLVVPLTGAPAWGVDYAVSNSTVTGAEAGITLGGAGAEATLCWGHQKRNHQPHVGGHELLRLEPCRGPGGRGRDEHPGRRG